MKFQLLGSPLTANRVVRSALTYLGDVLGRLREDLRTARDEGPYCPEVIHRLRVGTRKAAAALRLLRRAGVKIAGKQLSGRLVRLRHACGPLRDADVRWQHLLGWRTVADPGKWALLAGAATQSHAQALQDFATARKFLRRLRRDLRRPLDIVRQHLSAHAPAPHPRRLKRWLRKKVETGDQLASQPPRAAELHRLRLASKELRYLLAAAVGDDGPGFDDLVAKLLRVHETYGGIQDRQMILRWLETLEKSLPDDPASPNDLWPPALAAWRSTLATEIDSLLRTLDSRVTLPSA